LDLKRLQMGAYKYAESHELEKISMQHKNYQTRVSQPFTPYVSPVILYISIVTNLSPIRTFSLSVSFHHCLFLPSSKKVSYQTFKRKKPSNNVILCYVSKKHWTEATSPFLLLQNLTKRRHNFRSKYYRSA
jgi:hypothetical protein